jgi:hypothetical protein
MLIDMQGPVLLMPMFYAGTHLLVTILGPSQVINLLTNR